MKRTVILVLAGAILLGGGAARAQKKAVDREVAFAKGLALEFGFVGLGNQVLEDLLKRKDLDPEDVDRINLAKCDLLLLAARATPKVDQKIDYYEQATSKIEEVLGRFKKKETANEARLLYARAALAYGRVINTLMEDETDPQKKEEYRQKAETIYRGAIKACNDVKASLESAKDTDRDARNTYLQAWMQLGELQMNWANCARTETERKIRLEAAKKTLEDFIFEVGEDTPAGARALIFYAQCSEMEGDMEDALGNFSGTKDTLWEALTSKDNPVDPRVVPLLAAIMEEAYYHQIRLLNKMEKVDEAIQAGAELTARISQIQDVKPSKPYGLLALLEYSKALFTSGVPANKKKALTIAKQVSEDAGTSFIRSEAQKLIKKFTTEAGGLDATDPDTLFQVAEGSFRTGDYFDSLKNAKKVLAALKSDDQKKAFGFKTYKLIGRALTELGRYADATFAYGTACELFGDLARGDMKLQNALHDLAIRCQDISRVFRAKLPKSSRSQAQPVLDYADNIVTIYHPGAADLINLRAAKDFLDKGKYDQALAKIGLIKQTSRSYEEALVLRGRVYMEKQDYAQARKIFRDYLERYIQAHPNPQGPEARRSRRKAEAQAWFYLGTMAYYEADGLKGFKKPNPAKWKEVEKIFLSFPKKFADQTGFVEYAWYYVGRARTAMGDLKGAQEAYKNLKALKKNSRLIPNLALYIFDAHRKRILALEEKDPQPKKELVKAYKEAVAFADEYIKGNPLPQYAVLYKTFNYLVDLGQTEKALKIFGLIEKYHGKNPKYRVKILKYVKPKVVKILQDMGDFNRAKPIVDELLAAYKKGRWPLPILWLAVFEYGGWLQVEGAQVKEILGLNRPKVALEPPLELMSTLYKTVQAPESKFTLQWYKVVAQYTYLAYKAGKTDPRWLEEAKKYLRIAKSIDDFAGVKNAPYLWKGREKREFQKLSPAEKKKVLQEQEKERQDLYRIYKYLQGRLGVE